MDDPYGRFPWDPWLLDYLFAKLRYRAFHLFTILKRKTRVVSTPIKEGRWFKRNPIKTIFFTLLILMTIVLILAEIILRLNGEKPGLDRLGPAEQQIQTVGELKLIDSFYTDDEGVFKANKNYDWSNGIYGDGVYINSDGFRSIDFKKDNPGRNKILFLGDSFTWGASAKPISNCFVDLVAREGYTVYNTGIGGTGPSQYAFLARKYIPLLKPDYVIVMFYLGNDLYSPLDPLIPNQNLYYITDKLWLYAFDENGQQLTLEESFQKYFIQYYSPQTLKNKIKLFFTNSIVAKKFWLLIKSIKDGYKNKHEMENRVLKLLNQIKRTSEDNYAKFFLFLIPADPDMSDTKTNISAMQRLFKEFNPKTQKSISRLDYTNLPDGHLNNNGHYKMAKFILENLKK